MTEPVEDRTSKSPEDILSIRQALSTLPLPVCERAFRLAARRLGMNLLSGSSMMIKRGDIPSVLQEIEIVRRKKTGTWTNVPHPSSRVRLETRKGKLSTKELALQMLAKKPKT